MNTAVTSKGQVTIPKKIRDALNLAPGSRVEFDVNDNGQIVLHKAGAA
ncbi:MAG: AbrB/MazE/SpoVT family DNA-binding domain-containing protein, partial [Gammaproteobacteria bacterium]